MKKRALLIAGLWVPLLFGCEKELKEHPLPESMKQKIIKQNDPALKAKVISGTVTLAKEHENAMPDQARLFIIARPEGVEGGPPLAARRHSRVQLPFDYSIGPADVMLEGNQFDGSIRITARLDQDGNAKASPGDIEGDIVAQAGDKKVDIVLNRIVEGKKSSVTGTLRLDPSVAKDLPDNWKLFLIARSHGQEQGIPVAVKRLEAVEFPHRFSLGTQDVMMPGAEFTGTMSLTARIDRDGDARAGSGGHRRSADRRGGRRKCGGGFKAHRRHSDRKAGKSLDAKRNRATLSERILSRLQQAERTACQTPEERR